MEESHSRIVGIEQLGLDVLSQLSVVKKLTAQGVNGVLHVAILGRIIGRTVKPASELSCWHWPKTQRHG